MFEVGSTELSRRYPIVSKQWDVIMQFKNIISNECNKILQSLNVSTIVGIQIVAYFVIFNYYLLTIHFPCRTLQTAWRLWYF